MNGGDKGHSLSLTVLSIRAGSCCVYRFPLCSSAHCPWLHGSFSSGVCPSASPSPDHSLMASPPTWAFPSIRPSSHTVLVSIRCVHVVPPTSRGSSQGLHGWGPPLYQEKSIVAFILLSKLRNAALDCLQVDGLLVPRGNPSPFWYLSRI